MMMGAVVPSTMWKSSQWRGFPRPSSPPPFFWGGERENKKKNNNPKKPSREPMGPPGGQNSWFGLQILHADGRAESLVTGKTVNIAPVLPRRFDVDDSGNGHPIRFIGIVETHQGIVDFAAHARESEVAETGIERGHHLLDRSALGLDPKAS